MKSIFKIVVWSSGLVLIMALAIGVAIFTTDPNEHKDWLITQAENSLGRQVNLDGDLRWTLYPWVGIEVNDVKVGNASGFEAEEFFKADYLHFRIKLLPLLNERYEIDTVQIHGAEINLEINKNGNSNWQDIIARDTANDRRTALPLAAIILGGVDIQRARLSWRDATQNQAYEISNLQLEIGDLVYGEPIDIIMGMDLD
jgi:AsmA protein